MPTLNMSPQTGVVATLTFDGVSETGAVAGETRNVTGFSITNNLATPIFVHVEMETNKTRTFETTIAAGQTLSNSNIPAGQRPVIVWQTSPRPFWNNLNVQWRIPA